MTTFSPSTAFTVGVLRAVHQVLDDAPRIVDDPVADRLLTESERKLVQNRPSWFSNSASRALRLRILLRQRYTEDALAAAVSRGVQQYVMLGAGLDTFPYRQPSWALSLSLFEVDRPAEQHDKRARLAEAGLTSPSNLAYVESDFETDAILPRLQAAGFEPMLSTFVSCLGVMVYLSEGAIQRLFQSVALLPPGSEFVFTIAAPERDGLDVSLSRAATAMGEPWRTRMDPASLLSRISPLGFAELDQPSNVDLARNYAGDTAARLAAADQARILRVAVTSPAPSNCPASN